MTDDTCCDISYCIKTLIICSVVMMFMRCDSFDAEWDRSWTSVPHRVVKGIRNTFDDKPKLSRRELLRLTSREAAVS